MSFFQKYYREIKTIIVIVLATLIQVVALQSIIRPANLLPGGFLGISFLMHNLTQISISVSTFVLNAIVAMICYKGLSKRFAIYSMIQVTLSSVLLATLKFDPIIDDVILSVLIGGAVNGIYIAMTLSVGASTGGTDFIALYLSNKKGKSIWEYVFVFNTILLMIFGVTHNFEAAGYSILFQFISTKTIENFYHRYDQLTLQIITKKPEEIMAYYFEHHRHAMSCVDAVGGYSKEKVYMLYAVISSYELNDITNGILKVDNKVIINVMKTERFIGNFYRNKL